jgi:hypothetical protein
MDKPDFIEPGKQTSVNAVLSSAIDAMVNRGMTTLHDGIEWVVTYEVAMLVFHSHIKVRIVKPKWMPRRLFLFLLRCVCVTSADHIDRDKVEDMLGTDAPEKGGMKPPRDGGIWN